jgi:hypothetical protein
MNSLYDFIVKPIGERYNNTKKLAGKDFVTNTRIESFKNVNRRAEIIATPKTIETNLESGNEVIVHHNVFRRFYDIRGNEKNSKSYMFDNMYAVSQEQIYAYKNIDGNWKTHQDYCFVQPIKANDNTVDVEKPLHGILRYGNKSLDINEGDLVCFTPDSEFEFVFDGKLLYCMKSNNIILSHGNKRDAQEYNPSWTSSS